MSEDKLKRCEESRDLFYREFKKLEKQVKALLTYIGEHCDE